MERTLRQRKSKVTIGPPEGGFVRESWARVRRPFIAAFWWLRGRWLLRRGVVRGGRWHSPWWTWLLVFSVLLVLAGFVLWGFWDSLFTSGPLAGKPLGVPCGSHQGSCATGTSVIMPVVSLAISTVVFLVWRQWLVRRHYTHRMRKDAKRYMQTAGRLLDKVVGRDQLCDAIMNNLRDREARRPHVVVGRVGAGKTAVLVRLAELLAAKGAVPVPVRLGDAEEELDFCKLAHDRFRELVQEKVLTEGELDRCWRWLRMRSDKIVVLADGLEEALNSPKVTGQRDNKIREAIRRAGEENLPLVIASRPHAPLRAMEAAMTELEPLSEESALGYVAEAGIWRSDPVLLDRIVEVAHVAESPLYLEVARELHRTGRLESLWRPGAAADPMCQDRWALRADLLQEWMDALVDGSVRPELPLDHDTRQAAVEYLSALACLGLATDRADVALGELDPAIGVRRGPEGTGRRQRPVRTAQAAQSVRTVRAAWTVPAGQPPVRPTATPGPGGSYARWTQPSRTCSPDRSPDRSPVRSPVRNPDRSPGPGSAPETERRRPTAYARKDPGWMSGSLPPGAHAWGWCARWATPCAFSTASCSPTSDPVSCTGCSRRPPASRPWRR